MPTPIRRITTAQFALLALPAQLTRRITSVHLHHTWRPRRQDFRGLPTVEAMRRVHMEQNGWSDIAQHLTIDPQGGLWTGRNWNQAPASATGHNGDSAKGPFMIEMVGDFDAGQDPFDGAQRETAIAVVAHLLNAFGLGDANLKFHNQLTGLKSCPGTSLDRTTFLQAVNAVPQPKALSAGPFRPEHLLGSDVLRSGVAVDVTSDASVPENEATGRAIETATGAAVRESQRRMRGMAPRVMSRGAFDIGRGHTDWSMLKPHVINLAKGELSESGEFTTNPGDVDALVDGIRDYAAGNSSARLMIHAHGGLVGETDALSYARSMYRWWLDHDVYPVFFIWETSLLEIIGQFVLGRRDVFDFTSDLVIEGIVKAPGTAAWAGMKESARLASSEDTGDGVIGGARLFARKLAKLFKDNGAIPVHSVGHSAGAIFQSHLIPAMLTEGVPPIEHLYLLAPAARTELFHEMLAGRIGKQVKALSVFTMEEDAEEQDNCFQIYRKSLLYLVSHACEGLRRRPIVGLHKSMRKDPDLRALFGLTEEGTLTGKGKAAVHFSFAKGKPENPLTRSLAHGAFDNDPKTMSAVLRRIIDVPDNTGLGEADFPFPPQPRVFDFAVTGFAPAVAAGSAQTYSVLPTANAVSSASRIKALCIGINKYVNRPLDGCVNDARTWGKAFSQLGADVTYLLDEAATCEGMKSAMRSLLRSSAPGDVLILQYAGHGGQVPQRVDTEDDGFNEALIPVDYHTGALLVDDDLAGILTELPAGVTITLFMDCCHSGTNSRFAPVIRARASAGSKPRFMPLGDDVVEAYFASRSMRALGRGGDVSLPGVVHFAACQDHEFAWESDGQGDFTAAAASALVAAVRNRLPNETFAADMAALVGARQRQHPQLMEPDAGMRNRVLLAPAASGVAKG